MNSLHLEHPEDTAFLGPSYIYQSLELLKKVHRVFIGVDKPNDKVTIQFKVDGSPALIFGKHPSYGNQFFVGTKSVFNKTPKVNFTEEDIRRNHQGHLIPILKTALRYLPQLGLNTVMGGDLMFTYYLFETCKIDGHFRSHTFKPNVIRYVPQNSSILCNGLTGSTYSLGLFVHTHYLNGSILSPEASYDVNPILDNVHYSNDVWVGRTDFTKYFNDLSYDIKQFEELYKRFNILKLDFASYDTKAVAAFKQFANLHIKSNTLIDFADARNFLNYALVAQNKGGIKDYIHFVNENEKDLTHTLFAFISMMHMKQELLKKVPNMIGEFSLYVDEPNGFQSTKPEGLVVQDKETGYTLKLVERYEFSRRNFAQHST